MRVSNQKPTILSPVYKSKISGNMDVIDYMRQTLAAPLYNPVIQNQPVQLLANQTPITEDDIVSHVIACCQYAMSPTDEAWCKTLYGKTLVYFDQNTNLNIQNLFAIQSATKEKLPFPSQKVIYTPATDVIPVSKEFLAGQCEYDKYFATLSFYAKPNTLGFYFANEAAFNAFKTWLASQVAMVQSVLPSETNKLLIDFQANIHLSSLTESLLLRNNDNENNTDYSFARTLIFFLMNYTTTISSAEFGVLPFSISELYCPRSVVFVNVEKHTHATAKQIADEWNLINQSLQMKVQIMSNNQINKLTAAARNLRKIQGMAVNAANSAAKSAQRSLIVAFRKKEPNSVDMVRIVKKVIAKMATVNMSENSYKSVKMTFAKPNRRDPDDFNKQGKSVSTKYKPDIHIYIDTSGSISEDNYQDAIKACIQMARKLNINLYFNSFSHVLSQCTKLNTKDKSTKAVYAAFQKVPKVSGSTDYEQIWNYINQNKKRRRELSIIITDFEYSPPTHFVKHPKNLYYIPCSNMRWNRIVDSAKDFCDNMSHIEPQIRGRLLF